MTTHEDFLREAIRLALENVKSSNGGPFGAVVVKDGKIIGSGVNSVTATHDPTAHAEVNAIRDACRNLGDFQLHGCIIYSSCEPCPMCLGAIYWARPDKVFYAASQADANAAGFDDKFIYHEISLEPYRRRIPFIRLSHPDALKAFEEWEKNDKKIPY